MINKVYRCSTDVVLAGRIRFITGDDVLVLAEDKDSFNIPVFIIKHKEKPFHMSSNVFSLNTFIFLNQIIERTVK